MLLSLQGGARGANEGLPWAGSPGSTHKITLSATTHFIGEDAEA